MFLPAKGIMQRDIKCDAVTRTFRLQASCPAEAQRWLAQARAHGADARPQPGIFQRMGGPACPCLVFEEDARHCPETGAGLTGPSPQGSQGHGVRSHLMARAERLRAELHERWVRASLCGATVLGAFWETGKGSGLNWLARCVLSFKSPFGICPTI